MQKCEIWNNLLWRRNYLSFQRCQFYRVKRVLGIETSCDDTAVAVVDSENRILKSLRVNDRNIITKMGGISPQHFADQHRMHINRLVNNCVAESGLRLSDLDAVAVSSRPGIVIALKVGIDKALCLAREHYLNLIPVHHMRAHSIVPRLFQKDLKFPYLSLLISGGHSIIVIVRNAEHFEIIGESISGSPGECLDKLARELGIEPEGPHYGAAIEKLAKEADKDGYLKYFIKQSNTPGADFNFSNIKSTFLNKIRRNRPSYSEIPNYCASIQFYLMSHICKKIDAAFQFLQHSNLLLDFNSDSKYLIVAGGVASNAYLINCISKTAEIYNFKTIIPPRHLCTDNGEMIAWLGMELLLSSSKDIFMPFALPETIDCYDRKPIGLSIRDKVPKRPQRKFKAVQIHNNIVINL